MSVPGFVYGGLIAALVDCHAMATAMDIFIRERADLPAAWPESRF